MDLTARALSDMACVLSPVLSQATITDHVVLRGRYRALPVGLYGWHLQPQDQVGNATHLAPKQDCSCAAAAMALWLWSLCLH